MVHSSRADALHLLRVTAALAAAFMLAGCQSILHLPDGATFHSTLGTRTAVVQQGRVVLDGRPGTPRFDGINGAVRFSADGSRFAYLGMRGSQRFLVVDDREYGPFDGTAVGGVQISPLGRRVWLPVVQGERWHLWLDGTLGPAFDGIGVPHAVVSADESRLAYLARRDKVWRVVLDGIEGEPVQGFLDDLGFTADGTFFVAEQVGTRWRVRLGARVSEEFDAINKPGLMAGPGRRALAFIARRGQQVHMCVDLVCGPPHAQIGARAIVDASTIGDELLSAVFMGVVGGVLGAHAGIPAHQNPVLTTPTTAGGGGGRSIIVGSVVFSPDERHHAYVATDAGDAIMLDGKERVPLPPGATVEWMRFDSTSQVLVARLRGEASPLVVPLAGIQRHEVPSVTPVRLELDLDEPGALVFVDGRYAGAGLRELAVAPGQRTLRIEAPGRVPRTTNLEVAPGPATRWSISLDPDPVRVAVGEALASFNERTLAAAARAPAADLLRSRLVASVPLYEQVLGVATGGSGGDALVFGDSAMWVHTTSSSLSNVPRSYALRYADFARQPLPAHHYAFEVTLSPQVVVKTAGLHVSKERLIEFIAALHARLRATVPPGP